MNADGGRRLHSRGLVLDCDPFCRHWRCSTVDDGRQGRASMAEEDDMGLQPNPEHELAQKFEELKEKKNNKSLNLTKAF